MATRYFRLGQQMAKVGTVAHREFGPGAQQFVKAEDFDQVVDERNALQATVGWSRVENRKLRRECLALGVLFLGALACWLYQLWQGCGV